MLEISAQMRGVAAKLAAGLLRLLSLLGYLVYLHKLAAIKKGKRNLLLLDSLLFKATSHHPPMMKQATCQGPCR